jgi:hypothetical protein
MNFGRVDLAKLERLAQTSGITVPELHQALQARNMLGVLFCTSSP